MGLYIVYGPGGFDETKPNNNIVEQYEVEDVVDDTEVARQSALQKLLKLGLTEEEIVALMGGV